MTIGKQIGWSIAGVIAASILVGGVGWWCVTALGDRLDDAFKVSVRQSELEGDLKGQVFTLRLQNRGMLLFSHIKDDGQVEKCRVAYDNAVARSMELIQSITSLEPTERGRELLRQAQAAIEEHRTQQIEERRILATRKVADATAYDRKYLVPAGGRIVAALDELSQQDAARDAGLNAQGSALRRTAKAVLLMGLLCCAGMGVAVSYAMRRATGASLSCSDPEANWPP